MLQTRVYNYVTPYAHVHTALKPGVRMTGERNAWQLPVHALHVLKNLGNRVIFGILPYTHVYIQHIFPIYSSECEYY